MFVSANEKPKHVQRHHASLISREQQESLLKSKQEWKNNIISVSCNRFKGKYIIMQPINTNATVLDSDFSVSLSQIFYSLRSHFQVLSETNKRKQDSTNPAFKNWPRLLKYFESCREVNRINKSQKHKQERLNSGQNKK